MPRTNANTIVAGAKEQMHAAYLAGGRKRQMAPHVVYADGSCPHEGCAAKMQAIDFKLEDHGKGVHDPLVKAWWDDTGFAGCCPSCGGWIHFKIRSKEALTPEQAARLPQLPQDWFTKATVL